MGLLIKNALLDASLRQIYIEDGIIREIGSSLDQVQAEVLDAEGKSAIPAFFNSHTHAAMTLFRGYADDMFLQEWLTKKIWPLEARLTEEDVYWGSKLACLEMIKSGTTFFNDMYWHWCGTARAVQEMGLRAALSAVFIDGFDRKKAEEQISRNRELYEKSREFGPRVIFALGPHAIYTVSPESMKWCRDFSEKHGIAIHIHLSETEREVQDCIDTHGCRPVEYLEKLDFLSPRVIAVHCVWLDDREIDLLRKYRVKVVHNPTSNMKLAVGRTMPYKKLKEAGVTVALGTDGCSSNNNLDMTESMKFASLLQKFSAGDSCLLPAGETLAMATEEGARAIGLKAGRIEKGYLADLLLLDRYRAEMTPGYNLASDLVYAASGSCVDSVICDGRILMQLRHVEGEEEIVAKAREIAERLTGH